jgi:hypothetical protein
MWNEVRQREILHATPWEGKGFERTLEGELRAEREAQKSAVFARRHR